MKFDYLIHITRNGDKTYSVQVRDNGVEQPVSSKPVEGLDWQTLWQAIPRHIAKREDSKIEQLKRENAKLPEPKTWVPTAAGTPAPKAGQPPMAQPVVPVRESPNPQPPLEVATSAPVEIPKRGIVQGAVSGARTISVETGILPEEPASKPNRRAKR